MFFRSTIIAGSILTAFAGGANAADAIATHEPAPEAVIAPVAPAFSWSGGYIGAQTGYTFGKLTYGAMGQTKNFHEKSFLGGLYTGYNFEAGDNVILGLDGDVNYNGFKKTVKDPFYETSYKMHWNGAVRARAGYALDRFMPYVAGGLAVAKIEDKINYNSLSASGNRTKAGWTVGGGLDYAATDNLILRAEYRYSDYGKVNYHPNYGVDINSKLKTNEVRVGVAYKF